MVISVNRPEMSFRLKRAMCHAQNNEKGENAFGVCVYTVLCDVAWNHIANWEFVSPGIYHSASWSEKWMFGENE